MARTERRGGGAPRAQTKSDGRLTGPAVDPDQAVNEADERGQIKPLRPDKEWVRRARIKEVD